MNNNVQILCTRQLEDLLIQEAAKEGIEIDVEPFIKTEIIESVEVQQEIEGSLVLSATVVFTSVNAVEAVMENMIDVFPVWRIYCVGSATRRLVEKYFSFSEIMGIAESAAELAVQIVSASPDEIIFFCGDQRRDELPAILMHHSIEVNEIIVYQTIALPHVIKKHYHGILFFSPSAVDSFFQMNKIKPGTILFAIGNTTVSAINKYTKNKIIIAARPAKENLFEKMLEYFTGK